MLSVTEIILIAAGILAVILGYLIPNGLGSSELDFDGVEQKINDMVSRSIKNSQTKIDEMLDDCMEEAISKAERAMDRVTNDKMTAISDYSDTVMNDIHKNHDEVVFMYDMLNDKHKNLKNTVSEANRAAKEVKEAKAIRDAELEEQAKKKARLEAEALKKAQIEEEEKKKAQREEEAKRLARLEEEAKKKALLEEEARKKAEALMKAQLEEEAMKKAQLEAKARLEAQFEAQDDNQSVITPENEYTGAGFSSLTEILDRADAAAAQKTNNKVIRSEKPVQDGFIQEVYVPEQISNDIEPEYWPQANEDDYIEDNYIEDNSENVPQNEEVKDNQNVMSNTADSAENSAKVVSIADAPRKKTGNSEADGAASDPVSRNQRILDMHKSGKSAVVIARELRLGIGEVKLVIDLAGKHKKSRTSIM